MTVLFIFEGIFVYLHQCNNVVVFFVCLFVNHTLCDGGSVNAAILSLF